MFIIYTDIITCYYFEIHRNNEISDENTYNFSFSFEDQIITIEMQIINSVLASYDY